MKLKRRFESFICEVCGFENDPLSTGTRNHCQECLASLHVDEETPGDRESTCQGVMIPVSVREDSKKGWIITHRCRACKKRIENHISDDDNFDSLVLVAEGRWEDSFLRRGGA
ncbi:MAG: RNHCP domain-containing protein [Planctomycetes bacterium]|nr:RNHCP domain-containing protein [Planctomycetota bacterium]